MYAAAVGMHSLPRAVTAPGQHPCAPRARCPACCTDQCIHQQFMNVLPARPDHRPEHDSRVVTSARPPAQHSTCLPGGPRALPRQPHMSLHMRLALAPLVVARVEAQASGDGHLCIRPVLCRPQPRLQQGSQDSEPGTKLWHHSSNVPHDPQLLPSQLAHALSCIQAPADDMHAAPGRHRPPLLSGSPVPPPAPAASSLPPPLVGSSWALQARQGSNMVGAELSGGASKQDHRVLHGCCNPTTHSPLTMPPQLCVTDCCRGSTAAAGTDSSAAIGSHKHGSPSAGPSARQAGQQGTQPTQPLPDSQ